MAWIESHQQLERHPKTHELMRHMGWDLDTAIGKLHRFWWWCLDYAPTGDLHGTNDAILAGSVGLAHEDGKRFVDAMAQSRWIDRDNEVFRVHDWIDYAGRYLKESKFKRHPKKRKELRSVYRPRTVRGQSKLPNQPYQPNHHPPNPPSGGNGQGPEKLPHGVSPEFWELAPENIRIDSMRELWSEWVEYRRERKPKVTSRSAKMQLAELAEMGIEQATAAIRASIANGWQGIFPPRGSGKRVEAEDEFKPRAPTDDELKFLFPKEA